MYHVHIYFVIIFPQVTVRLYIFSLIWWPLYQLSIPLSTAWLCYLPFYVDLAEFNGWRCNESIRKGAGVSGWICKILSKYFQTKLIKTVDIDKQCIVGLHPHGKAISNTSCACMHTVPIAIAMLNDIYQSYRRPILYDN
jgi:hypothetical protein